MVEDKQSSVLKDNNNHRKEMADIFWEFDMTTNNFNMHRPKKQPFRLAGTDYVIERSSICPKTNGSVFLAKDTRTNTVLAVKIAQKKKALNELYNEKLILSLLPEHPNIICLHDYVETQNQNFLFLEYGGISLRKYLDTVGGRLTEIKAKPFLAQMISAVDILHQNKISHHDIKLDNFVVDPKLTVRLIDFGYSLRYDTQLVSHFYGSLPYACAEVLQRQPHCPEKADVYSLGVCLFRMLCGHLPFCDPNVDDPKSLLAKTKRGLFVIPHEVFVSERIKTLLHGTLKPAESERFDLQMVLSVYSGMNR